MKFVNKENLTTFWGQIKSKLDKKIDTPATDGTAGQVLAKTSTGSEWKTLDIPEPCQCVPLSAQDITDVMSEQS